MTKRIEQLDWHKVAGQVNDNGYAVLNAVLDAKECDGLKLLYGDPAIYRKTITMERYRFGLGEYKYFSYPLPVIVQELRQAIYPKLAPVANNWMKALNIQKHFPGTLNSLLDECHAHNQLRPTPLILKYGKGGAQSKALVLKPGKGDILLFTTSFRPVKGSKGYYRVNMKHGVSEITRGHRHTLGIIFHDAA